MNKIGEYEIIGDEHATSSAKYWKARKGVEYFFLKCFNDPKRPSDRVGEAIRKAKNKECEEFIRERKIIIKKLRSFPGGNLVAPVEFFEYKGRFYQSTQWRDIKARKCMEVARLSEKEKLLIIKTAAAALSNLHSEGVIHLDVKPDNLPVAAIMSGRLTCSLIDFDASFCEGELPGPEKVSVTDPYMSPELAAYKMGSDLYQGKVTTKNDVFALAIVLHKYWTGKNFLYSGSDSPDNDPYLYNIVNDGKPVNTAPEVPAWLSSLLMQMIRRNPDERPTMEQVLEALNNRSSTATEQAEEKREPEKPKAPPEKKPVFRVEKPADFFKAEREKRERAQEKLISTYKRGARFPEDAVSFKISASGINAIFEYSNGVRIALSIDDAIRKGYIAR